MDGIERPEPGRGARPRHGRHAGSHEAGLGAPAGRAAVEESSREPGARSSGCARRATTPSRRARWASACSTTWRSRRARDRGARSPPRPSSTGTSTMATARTRLLRPPRCSPCAPTGLLLPRHGPVRRGGHGAGRGHGPSTSPCRPDRGTRSGCYWSMWSCRWRGGSARHGDRLAASTPAATTPSSCRLDEGSSPPWRGGTPVRRRGGAPLALRSKGATTSAPSRARWPPRSRRPPAVESRPSTEVTARHSARAHVARWWDPKVDRAPPDSEAGRRSTALVAAVRGARLTLTTSGHNVSQPVRCEPRAGSRTDLAR